MDLAAINIQRGHDLGLNTLNDTREALGLDPYTSFGQITDDLATVQALQQAFGNNVDAIDLWTGGLSEKHPTGSMVGETFQKIIGDQFTDLRAGDQFWFERQGFDADTMAAIKGTTLSSVIERNTDTTAIQDDAFVFAVRHTSDTVSEDPDAPQLVIGVAGGPAIVGGPQGDTLVAATDTHAMQHMTGSTGGDQFVISGKVTITDFNPAEGDKLVVSDHHDPKVNFKGGNAIVHSGNDTVTLEHVTQAQLQGHDWWIS
jgi:peroxidase